ncbi:MAG: hypothetical protein AB4911_11115 [Oscillochloridaceae bacterium umkhey_bin13]
MSGTPDEPMITAGPWWARAGREGSWQLALLAGWLGLIALALLGLGMLAAALQAQRDEARSTDLALVMTASLPAEGLAERVFDLYRRGLMPQILVAGPGREGLRAQLIERGMREEVILLVADEPVTSVAAQAVTRAAQAQGAQSVLIITAPEALLASVKIAQDQGLRAYAAPLAGRPSVAILLQASLNYWQYVLAL